MIRPISILFQGGNSINFSAFDQKNFTFSQKLRVSAQRAKSFFTEANPIIGFVIALSFLFLVMALLLFNIVFLREAGLTPKVFILVIDVLAIGVVISGIENFGSRALVLKTFAADNGFEFKPNFSVKSANSSMFRIGYLNIARNAVLGTHAGSNFAVFDFRYTKGSGRYPAPVLFTVLALNTGTSYPHTIAENRRGHFKQWRSYKKPEHEQTTDIQDNFRVFSQSPKTSKELSVVLNQKVVDSLLKASSKADIELNGKDVFVFMPGTLKSAAGFQSLFDTIEKIQS